MQNACAVFVVSHEAQVYINDNQHQHHAFLLLRQQCFAHQTVDTRYHHNHCEHGQDHGRRILEQNIR